MSDPSPDDDRWLDGCDLDFADPRTIIPDDQIATLVMFVDCQDDPEAVERRRVELVEWAAALAGRK
jgi:hypothetical protein